MIMRFILLAFIITGSAAAQVTVGQYEIRERTASGYTTYGLSLSNGQVIGKTGGVPAAITIDISKVSGLQTALDGKAEASHTQSITSITGSNAARLFGTPSTGTTASEISISYINSPFSISAAQLNFNVANALNGLTTTRGSIPYRGNLSWTALAPGTSGHALVSNGSGADPSYQAVVLPGGTLALGGFSSITGSLAVANGGTGATTQANARTNLGLAIGTNVQAWNGKLDALAALLPAIGVLTNDGDGGLSWTPTGSGNDQIPITTAGYLTVNGVLRSTNGLSTGELGTNNIFFGNIDESGFWTALVASTPTANRTITIPDSSGAMVTTGDTGTVSNTMLAHSSVTIFGSVLSLGGSLVSLPAVKLGTATDPDTIAPSENGIGWADDKFTIQTPAGALQMYLAGDPEESTIYWPGRITADSFEAASLSASIAGSQVDHGSLPMGVMMDSQTAPAREWQDSAGYAGNNGLTYTNTGPLSTSEPSTPGTYFAAIEVTDGGTEARNAIVGRIRTAAQMNVPVIVSVPATASSTGTAGQIAYDSSYLYICVAANTWKRVAIASW